MKITNGFTQGKMNKDLDERLLPKGQYRDALNIEVNNSNGAGVGALENIKGNTKISSYSFPSEESNLVTIGSISNESTNDIYWMVSGTEFDYVFRYNSSTNLTTALLKDTKGRVLNFNSSFLINGINIIDDLLFWTDDKNPPRRLNVTKVYAADGFVEDDISVIVKPPLNAPTVSLSNSSGPDSNKENNIEDKFIQFSYRYRYENDEYSAMSPFSALAFTPDVFNYDYGDAELDSMINKFNEVTITFNTGSERVKDVQILFRDTLDNTVHVIEKLDKSWYASNENWQDNTNQTIKFSNNKIFSVLPPDEVTRLFDNVPLKAKAQDIIGSRLLYGNYVQFFDIIDSDFINITPNFTLAHQESNSTNFPLRTFKSNRDYEVGLAYLDDYGRMTTVLTSSENTVHIPPKNSVTGNNLRLSISNEAPQFATKYRIFIKQNKGVYYSIFPLYYYIDGVFRWFKISESDVDKVKVGDYISAKIFKSEPVEEADNFKVIEVSVKEKDFLNNDELGGLYFKIKTESGSTLFDGSDIFQTNFSTQGIGSNNNNNKSQPYLATAGGIAFGQAVIDIPVFYGKSTTHTQINLSPLPGVLPYSAPTWSNTIDARYKILMESSDTFSVYLFSSSGYVLHYDTSLHSAVIPNNKQVELIDGNYQSLTVPLTYLNFQDTSGYTKGDYWVINVNTNQGLTIGQTQTQWATGGYLGNAFAILPESSWSPDINAQVSYPQPGYFTQDRPILPGARIRLRIKDQEDYDEDEEETAVWQEWQEWISPRKYANLQEWFWESGAYRTFKQLNQKEENIRWDNVFFRRGYGRTSVSSNSNDGVTNQISQLSITPAGLASKPIWMIIRGTGQSADGTNVDKRPVIKVDFQVVQQTSLNTFETEGKMDLEDVFYETNLTLDITTDADGKKVHNGTQLNQVLGSNAAIVDLNDFTVNANFNAYCFGNGIESMVIREDWNGRHLKYSPRASSTYDDYQQERVEEALTYSGVYRETSGINNLNEFNLSLANFKYLDKSFASIQKIKARDTDLVVFQEDKVSKILYGKNLLSDSVGGGNIASIPQVLGTQVSFTGEYGISQNPESFAQWGNNMYFTDEYRGAVCRLAGNGIFEISSFGMSSWFRDLFIDESGKQKIGGYDPFKNKYVLSARDANSSIVIDFEIIDKDPQGG